MLSSDSISLEWGKGTAVMLTFFCTLPVTWLPCLEGRHDALRDEEDGRGSDFRRGRDTWEGGKLMAAIVAKVKGLLLESQYG